MGWRRNFRRAAVVADLTEENAAASVVNRVLEEAGRIDTLIINAGTLADGLVAGLTDEELSRVYELNLWAAFRMLRAALKPMIMNRSGNIVVISSTAAQRPNAGQAAYASSKAALEAFVRITARETATRGIQSQRSSTGITRRRNERAHSGRSHGPGTSVDSDGTTRRS